MDFSVTTFKIHYFALYFDSLVTKIKKTIFFQSKQYSSYMKKRTIHRMKDLRDFTVFFLLKTQFFANNHELIGNTVSILDS